MLVSDLQSALIVSLVDWKAPTSPEGVKSSSTPRPSGGLLALVLNIFVPILSLSDCFVSLPVELRHTNRFLCGSFFNPKLRYEFGECCLRRAIEARWRDVSGMTNGRIGSAYVDVREREVSLDECRKSL